MSEEEFLRLDDAEETDLEYIDGIAYVKGVVNEDHRDVVGELDYLFGGHRRKVGGTFGPEFRVRLQTGRYVKPDNGYWPKGTPSTNGALPAVAVEVRSRNETMAAQRRKCRMYREAGVPCVWLIDPINRVVEVFEDDLDAEPLARDGVLSTKYLPGFEVPLPELFAVLDRQ